MTQTGAVEIYDWAETVLGVPPASPIGRAVRFISENLFVGPNLVDSPEVTPGNEPEDQTQNGFAGGGDFNIAFSPRNYDHWLAALLWNTWAAPAGSASTPIRTSGSDEVTYNPTTRTLTTTGSWTNAPVNGDKILVWQSSNAYLNGIHTVESWTATTIVLEQDGILSDSARIPAIAVAENITIMRPERLTNSLTPGLQSLGFEKRINRTRGTYRGVTATQGAPTIDFSQFFGAVPTRLQLQGTGDAPITGSMSFDAAREQNSSAATGASTVLTGTTAYDATPIMQGIECVKKCRLYVPSMSAVAGDAGKIEDTLRLCPQSFQLELGNGLSTTQLMCAQPEKDYQFGEPIATVQVSGIYDSPFSRVAFNQQYDAVFELALVATNGEGYLIKFPRAKVQASRADTGGRRQTITGQMTVKAFRQTGSPAAGDSARAVEIYRFRQA